MAIRKRKVRVHRNSEARAKKLTKGELVAVLPASAPDVSPDTSRNQQVEARVDPNEPFSIQMDWDDVRMTAARLYGRGFRRSQIARALVEHLVSPESVQRRSEEQMLQYASSKLRRWERSQDFRDLIYRYAVVELDMSTPEILVGLSKRAKRGRVDAARLALEITGRHTREDEKGATNVTINLANIPRPE